MIAPTVWIFQGDNAAFSAGVFSDYSRAEAWIKQHKLTGMLTEYPLDQGVYDWCIASNCFVPKKPLHRESGFIAGFTSATMTHFRFEDGVVR